MGTTFRALPLVVLMGTTALAQGPTFGVGRTPTPEEIRALDISISPTGESSRRGGEAPKRGRRSIARSARRVTGRGDSAARLPF